VDPRLVAVIFLGYLIGAIPFGLVVGKLTRGVDVREYGSGKMGATNVLRTLGVRVGVLVFAADLAKGAAAVLLSKAILDTHAAAVAAAITAIVGHNWPVYVRFWGGRGVTTALGGLSALAPLVAAGCLGIGVVIIAWSRYVSLGSMAGALSGGIIMASLVALDRQPVEFLVYALIASCLIIFQHRDNIARLRSGTERRLGGGRG
jgi:glycerol-3-phosphate acyltransferase PlsY